MSKDNYGELRLYPGQRVKLSWDQELFWATAVRKISEQSWEFVDDTGQLYDRMSTRAFIMEVPPLEQLADAAD